MSKTKRTFRSFAGGLLAGGLVLIGTLPSTAAAQEMDTRWLPWIGCWEVSEAGEQESPMLCVSPLAGERGVELSTWSGGEVVSTEVIEADGALRDVAREGCDGFQEASFSDDAKRVYLNSQYVCEGGVERGGTGMLAFANPVEWLDIKVVEVAGNKVPMVLRYRPARGTRVENAGMDYLLADRAMSVKAARIAVAAPLTADDLIEANGKVDGKAVEALVAERGDDFDVNADVLTEMADAGVSENLIDLVVAVSYPDKFTVSAGMPDVDRAQGDRTARPYDSYGYRGRWGFWDPFFYDFYGPWYYSYARYGMSPYYYGGYGWGGGYWGYYRPTTVIVDNQPDYQPRTHGRVISGRGYSRGSSSASPSSRTSRSPSTRSAPSSGRSSGSISSSGARRGGSSTSTGRTAKRRGGGGGI